MRDLIYLLIGFCLFIMFSCNSVSGIDSSSDPIKHDKWNSLLQKYVDGNGMVNYKGFIADSLALNEYLALVESNHPNAENWNESQRLAYWLNAYNAFTIRLIIRHYPVKSIKEIAGSIPYVNSPWDIKFIEIEGAKYDLNNLEHGIIRKEFKEPRIHFALVCAAVSCPKLRNEAYAANKLEDQLDDQARVFFNDPNKNLIKNDQVQISKLLSWYWGDFKELAEDRIAYINQYSSVKASVDAKIDYMDYNWQLNEQ